MNVSLTVEEYYDIIKQQTNDNLVLYFFCCILTVVWIVYVLFFNSRLLGSIATFLLNFYLKRYSQTDLNNVCSIKIRSLSVSFLSGKIMFRGVHYATIDYMLYIQDGWITFAYWKPSFTYENAKPNEKAKKDKSSSVLNDSPIVPTKKRTARLNIFLYNFQLHYYNSWKTQMKTSSGEKCSKLGSFIKFLSHNFNLNSLYRNETLNVNLTTASNMLQSSANTDFTEDLMQLFSVVNIKMQKGKLFAGNSTLPSTLLMQLSSAKMELVTEKSQSKMDDYCFILRGDLSKLEFSLIPNKSILKSLAISILNTEKKLENRLLIFRCVQSDFEYVQDMPSILTFDRRHFKKTESGELIQTEKEPQWSLSLNCNKHTTINYGPWYDLQREALWKFFFPSTYEKLEPQPEPTLNERRQTSKFDIFIKFKDPNTELNLLFTSNQLENPYNLNSDHSNATILAVERKLTLKCKQDSFLNLSIPWLTKEYGYKTIICGEFNSVMSNTNLAFKEFINVEKVKLDIDINYPLQWNDQQFWNINIDFYHGSAFFVFYFKQFFQDLINDWSSRHMGDVRRFVPFLYTIQLNCTECEVILPCNQHNWIDTAVLENNTFFGVCLTKCFLKLEIPFEEFLPEKTSVTLDVDIGEACARFIVPPTNSSLALLKILRKNIRYVTLENGEQYEFDSKYWSQFNSRTYSNANQQLENNNNNNNNIKSSSSDKKTSQSRLNKKILSSSEAKTSKQQNNVRFSSNVAYENSHSKTNSSSNEHLEKNWIECWRAKCAKVKLKFDYHPCPVLEWNNRDLASVRNLLSMNSPNFDCEILSPDTIFLEIEIGPSVVMLYGTFLKRLWYIKEAFFSWDQFFTEMPKNFDQLLAMQSQQNSSLKSPVSKPFHDVPVSLMACNQKDPRNFRPLSVKLSLAIHNINGHLALDLTDGVGATPLPIGFSDRLVLELDKTYAETKLQLFVDPVNIFVEDLMPRSYDKNLFQGHLCLSGVQLRGHAMFSDEMRTKTDTLEYAWLLEILLGDVTGHVSPVQAEQLFHGIETIFTTLLENDYDLQPVYSNRVDPGLPFKYEVVRFSLDKVDLYLVESGTALNVNLDPVRLSLCNSHSDTYAKCLSAILGGLKLKLFVNEASRADIESTCTSTTNFHNQTNLNKSRKSATLSSFNLSTSSLSSSNSQNTLIEKTSPKSSTRKRGDSSSTLIMNNANSKCFDSNDFNYWFEGSSLFIGVIKIDLMLESGHPEEQLKFLKLHDAKTKRLYFIWNNGLNEHKKCGCNGGGCSYYSVFPTEENFDFFDLKKSINRTNKLFGDSLFYPGVHVLDSHPLMRSKYAPEAYKYDKMPSETLNNDLAQRHSKRTLSKPFLHRSISSISEVFYNKNNKNEDDYFTASEDSDEENLENFDDSVSRFDQNDSKSFKSLSKHSHVSTSQRFLNEDSTLKRLNSNLINSHNILNDVEVEAKMDLNFDIRRPILDSSLPKYCYLKHLSRAYVTNWNKKCFYPYYEDFSDKNISFSYRQKGISFSYDNKDLDKSEINQETNDKNFNASNSHRNDFCAANSNDETHDEHRKVNIKFSTLDCFVTPLFLTGLSRLTNSLKHYKINPNSLITELEAKTKAHCASNWIKEKISMTQVSLKIPQIRFFSLQCGLAEGDKISNAFTNTLENPDQFITLSLFTIFINSIQTQLIDVSQRTTALFMIDQIVTQFSRVYDQSTIENLSEKLKLSCIYSNDSLLKNNLFLLSNLKSLLMYECAFDSIRIKALKNASSNELAAQNRVDSARISLCDFDIAKIWFSFPEPPQSPKGKRKIPFSRFDWNLLSSVSPAVISWLCVAKHSLRPIRDFIELRSKRYTQIVGALVTGALKNREKLELEINALNDIYNNRDTNNTVYKSKYSEFARFGRHKIYHSKKVNPSDTVANFMKVYLTNSAYELYKDPNFKLVKLMRSYLLYFNDEFQSDMNSNLIPETKIIKKGISEVLNSWSNIIVTNEDETNRAEEFKFFTEFRENKYEFDQSSDEFQMLNSDDNSQNQNLNKNSNETNQESDIVVLVDQNSGLVTSQLVKKVPKNSSNRTDILDKEELGFRSGHVGPKLRRSNKIFKPILSAIGIDAPSGTLVDNLFKEFGTVLLGNLNIKSVHINILSADTSFKNSSESLANAKSSNDKIITTILSFDDLLLNLSIRQILPPEQQANASNQDNVQASENANLLSMSNPLYKSETANKSSNMTSNRYLTKIDANIRINSLKQEVNMPLLRLVHQLYSIIADSTEFDKEQNRLVQSNQESFSNSEYLSESVREFKVLNLNQSPLVLNNISDCWRYMVGALELREFVPEVKYVEKNELLIDRKSSQKHPKYVHVTKDVLLCSKTDRSQISFFGSLNIRKVNSKAGVNTLTLSGEMSNIQASVLFGRKVTTHNRSKYEGSINMCMDATHGVLLENESKQNVVEIKINKSHMFGCLKNMQVNHTLFSFIHVGQIGIDVPLRPMLVHGVVYRQSKELEQNILPEIKNFAIFDESSSSSSQANLGEAKTDSNLNEDKRHTKKDSQGKVNDQIDQKANKKSAQDAPLQMQTRRTPSYLKNKQSIKKSKFTFQLKAKLDGCEISAKLLEKPCLKAAYSIREIYCNSLVTNQTSKTHCAFNSHYLSFQCDDEPQVVFYLPSIALNASHSINVSNIALDFDMKIAPLNRELNAEVIAQLFFVAKVFLKEMNFILLAVYNLDQTSADLRKSKNIKATKHTTSAQSACASILFEVKIELGRICLTGITPSNTALTVCSGEKSALCISNANNPDCKTQIELNCLISAELKTMKEQTWFQLAYFTTKFDLSNNFDSSNEQRESMVINVDKPRFYLQPGAIDSAILFWLNYKNTYEFWIEQRQQISNLLLESNFPPNLNANSSSSPSPPSSSSKSNSKLDKTGAKSQFLLIKLRVTGLGLALPLSTKISRDFSSQSFDCLIITLNETAIYACSSGCVVSKGQFSNFCLRFSDNFNLSSSEWAPANLFLPSSTTNQQPSEFYSATSKANAHNKVNLMNAWVVPSGNYEVCSSTIEKPTAEKPSPQWILSVKWKMEGIEVNLDTCIGKWLNKLADTVTRLADTQNINNEAFNFWLQLFFNTDSYEQNNEIKRLKRELNYYMEKGDMSKVNLIQSRLDILNLATYPERAKQIFVKSIRRKSSIFNEMTRNNLKGQLGFNTGSNSTNIVTTPSKLIEKLARIPNSRSGEPASPQSTYNRNSTNETECLDQEQAKKHGARRHSYSNDDLAQQHLLGYDSRNNLARQTVIEESNENAEASSDDAARPSQIRSASTRSHSSSHHQPMQATSAPAIDFKLSVKIDINSGKCVLHANNTINPKNLNMSTKKQPASSFSHIEQEMRITNFVFPAIGVKTFYESIHKKAEHLPNTKLSKKANLYAIIKVESFVMPQQHSTLINRDLFPNSTRDMIISPALLDFLEQTLEPFDINLSKSSSTLFNDENEFCKKAAAGGGGAGIKKQKNEAEDKNINLNSNSQQQQQQQQQVASYFPIDVVVFISMLPSSIRFTCLPQSTMECLLKLPSVEMVFSTNRVDEQTQSKLAALLNSDTFNDFGQAQTSENADFKFSSNKSSSNANNSNNNVTSNESGLSLTCSMTDFSLKFYNRLAMRNQFDNRVYYNESLNYTEDKDSLSVRVAYIKVNITRFRKVLSNGNALTDGTYSMLDNDVKLSVLADIGNSSFTYDMRNIKEVFVFPKIWYRRSLARRVFLGDDSQTTGASSNSPTQNEEDAPPNINPHDESLNSSYLNSDYDDTFSSPSEIKRTNNLNVNSIQNESLNGSYFLNPNWKTLVLISVNLAGFEIKMNVGNVMGNVNLITKNGSCISKISLSKFGPKDVKFNFSLENSRLIAEGGSSGCLLRIQDITAAVEFNDKNKLTKCPSHKIEFGIFAAECRVDSAYNQTSPILAFRFSSLNLRLNDAWEHSLISSSLNINKMPEALIEVNVTWDQLHIMITRSTTPDLILLYYKLIEFFEKQFSEGKDYIKECELDIFYDLKVKQQFIEKNKETTVKKLFNANGGNIQLKGNNFTLITFHGNSFKAIKWAVFSLNEPSMDFASQTHPIHDSADAGSLVLHNQQSLSFYLGRNERKRDMASIYMAYRDSTSIFTKFQTINEWFEYAHSTIDAAGLRDFPRFSSDEHPLLMSQTLAKKSSNKYNDQTKWEEIFHLPSLQIFCDTNQVNSVVRFEFKTEFHDHIQLTFRTELFGFLHELITSYVKETDLTRSKEPNIPNPKKDERVYECVRWELQPTLRLISKFGSSVEPLGVDALLKSLGFHHARSTIPKWIQRGLLDNLNDIMNNLIKVYVKLLSDTNANASNSNNSATLNG